MKRKNVVEVGSFLCIAFLLSFNVFAQNMEAVSNTDVLPQKGTKVVVADGSAIINNGDQSAARNEAINDAIKKAVEQAVGAILSSRSVIENYNLLNREIYAEATNFVHDYKILKENSNNNVYNISLQATIGLNHLREALDKLGLLKSEKEPTVAVIILEQNIGEKRLESALFYAPLTPFEGYIIPEVRVLNEVGNMSIAESELIKRLLSAGVNVEDDAVLLKDIKISPGYKIQSLDDNTVKEIGRLTNVDVIIYGKAVAKLYGNIAGSEMKSAQADVSLRAVDARNGGILASGEEHAASVHIDALTAGNEAIKKATDTLADNIIPAMLKRWKQESGDSHHIKITINGVKTFAEFVGVKNQLIAINGISNVNEESIGKEDVTLDVDYNSDAQHLVSTILSNKNILSNFTVTNTTSDTITLQRR